MDRVVVIAAMVALAVIVVACSSDGGDAPDSTTEPVERGTVVSGTPVGTQTAAATARPTPSPQPTIPKASDFPTPEILPWFDGWLLEDETALHKAAFDGDLEAVRNLIKQGEDVNAEAQLSLSDGSNPMDGGVYQWLRGKKYVVTPLHLAAANGSRYVVEALLDAGADLDALCGDWNALYLAAGYNPDPSVTALLLDRGSDLNPTRLYSETVLHQAARYSSSPAVIALLVERGVADVNSQARYGGTPLHQAARYNPNAAVIEELIAQGADVAANPVGYTPLELAAKHNPHVSVTSALLDGGSDINGSYENRGTAPLALAAHNSNPAVAAMLLERGARPNGKDQWARPLYIAIQRGNLQLIEMLLDAGADVSLEHRYGDACYAAREFGIAPEGNTAEVYKRLCPDEGNSAGG